MILGGILALFVPLPMFRGMGAGLIVTGLSGLTVNVLMMSGVNSEIAMTIGSSLNVVVGAVMLFTPMAPMGVALIGGGLVAIAGGWISVALGGEFKTGAMVGARVGMLVALAFMPKVLALKASFKASSAKSDLANGVGEKHHFLTNKHKTFVNRFKKITDQYGLDLNDSWNLEFMTGHKGRHTHDYHRFMLKETIRIHDIANGNKTIFMQEFNNLKTTVKNNSGMLQKGFDWELFNSRWRM